MMDKKNGPGRMDQEGWTWTDRKGWLSKGEPEDKTYREARLGKRGFSLSFNQNLEQTYIRAFTFYKYMYIYTYMI